MRKANKHYLDFKNKKVLVMGLGLHGGGVAAVRWLYRKGAKITVTDLKTRKELGFSLKKLKDFHGVIYHLGGHKKTDFLACDVVIKGPGVPANSPYLKIAKKNKVPVVTDIHIFLASIPHGARIIGVTGTKGKSTTATLIAEVLRRKYSVHLAGNIRKSVLDVLPKIKSGDFVVLELSSFQLEDIADLKYRFPVAVFTSLFPDHLNRHKTFMAYQKAKEVIFKYQKKGDLLVANGDASSVCRSAKSAKSHVIYVSEKDFAKNAARVVGEHLGIPDAKIDKVLKIFKGLPGRLEEIRILNGVIFINDTTATNPGAAIFGVKFIRKKYHDKKLIVIAGGTDKELKFGELINVLKKFVHGVVLLPGSATDKILREAKENRGWAMSKSMSEAVHKAYRLAMSIKGIRGSVVLLSPGAASFGLFQHEFDRGGKFNAAIRKLK